MTPHLAQAADAVDVLLNSDALTWDEAVGAAARAPQYLLRALSLSGAWESTTPEDRAALCAALGAGVRLAQQRPPHARHRRHATPHLTLLAMDCAHLIHTNDTTRAWPELLLQRTTQITQAADNHTTYSTLAPMWQAGVLYSLSRRETGGRRTSALSSALRYAKRLEHTHQPALDEPHPPTLPSRFGSTAGLARSLHQRLGAFPSAWQLYALRRIDVLNETPLEAVSNTALNRNVARAHGATIPEPSPVP
ncbi:hypothetical protein ACFW5W_28410 [Streptomyces sp. NPDC058783]|uniref:hypothetical protein n=1 Tax=Streptomyces sp. NPDC058783 TaxID=3346633 RepID=UPI003698D2AD